MEIPVIRSGISPITRIFRTRADSSVPWKDAGSQSLIKSVEKMNAASPKNAITVEHILLYSMNLPARTFCPCAAILVNAGCVGEKVAIDSVNICLKSWAATA